MKIKCSRHYSDSRSCIEQGYAQSDQCSYCAPTLTKRLSWRTKQAQFFQSLGCGQVHVIHFMGACEACGRSVYSHSCAGQRLCDDRVEDSPDPRGIIPPGHCMNLYHASEYDMTGRDVMTCAACADDGDRYRAIMAKTKAAGIWLKPNVIGYLCAVCGKSGPECKGENHKFVCGEELTR